MATESSLQVLCVTGAQPQNICEICGGAQLGIIKEVKTIPQTTPLQFLRIKI